MLCFFRRQFVHIHEIKPVSTLHKQIYEGFIILDWSKLLMYEIHYKYRTAKYGSGAKLLFTETDSLVFQIKTDDVYEDIYETKSFFDFIDYLRDSQFYDCVNKKVIGRMTDEVRGRIISEFVELKSNLSSLFKADNKGMEKSKGVNKSAVKSIRYK